MANQDPVTRSRISHAVSWLIALCLIGLGVYLSKINFLSNEWLSRSGCAVVMLGLWSGLGGIIQERLLSNRMRRRRRNTKIEAKVRLEDEQLNDDEIDKELEKIDDNFEKESSELSQNLKLSFGSLEISLLLTGTFLWGFGDLFV